MRRIVEISGVGQVLAAACAEKGFRTVEDVASAKVADLIAVPGVSTIRANQLIQAAQGLLRSSSRPEVIHADPSQAAMPPHKGNASQPVARVTNGAGDQSEAAQPRGDLSVLTPVTVSSAKVAPTRQDTANKKKKEQKTKAAEKKRSKKGSKTKNRTDKKSKSEKKNKDPKKGKKSKKNNKNKIGKKVKARRNKKKSGKNKS